MLNFRYLNISMISSSMSEKFPSTILSLKRNSVGILSYISEDDTTTDVSIYKFNTLFRKRFRCREFWIFRNFYDLGFTTQLIVKVPTIILDISVLFSYNSMFLRLQSCHVPVRSVFDQSKFCSFVHISSNHPFEVLQFLKCVTLFS